MPSQAKSSSTSEPRKPVKRDADLEKSGQREKVSPVREWLDAIVVAFLLAMFIRVFVVELFMIPSPSMTPTLIGVEPPQQAVSYFDVDKDGREDMILRSGQAFHVYLKKGDRFQYAGEQDPGPDYELWMRKSKRKQQDKILVGKFLYWFSPPNRGDIVVFKVPESIFESAKPIYIKRVVGLPGETLTFEPAPGSPGHENTMGWLVADGKRVTEPPFFQTQRYEYRDIVMSMDRFNLPSYAEYSDRGYSLDLEKVEVPKDGVYVFGDNTVSSRDSRYWGYVDFPHLRGQAIMRYWPLKGFGFLK